MNIGHEDDELNPYLEPTADINDPARIRKSLVVLSAMAIVQTNTIACLSVCRENVADGFHAEGDSGVSDGESVRRGLCDIHVAEEGHQGGMCVCAV